MKYCDRGVEILKSADGAATEAMSTHVENCGVCARALGSEKIRNNTQLGSGRTETVGEMVVRISNTIN